VYEIDFSAGVLNEICDIGNNVIWGFTSPLEFALPEGGLVLDLDADDSSGPFAGHYRVVSICTRILPVCDADVLLSNDEASIDSLVVEIQSDFIEGSEMLTTPFSGAVSLQGDSTHRLVLINFGPTGTDIFEQALLNMRYVIAPEAIFTAERRVQFTAYAGDSISNQAIAYLNIDLETVPYAGEDAVVEICKDGIFTYMFGELGENATEGGQWIPPLTNENGYFNTYHDEPGTYYYTVQEGECTADTAVVEVIMYPKPPIHILPDPDEFIAYLCPGDTIIWDVSIPGGVSYFWHGLDITGPIAMVTEPRWYTVEVLDENGCSNYDDVLVLMSENESVLTEEDYSLCEGEVYEWAENAYSTDTIVCISYPFEKGCDSTHCLQLTFHPTYQFYDTYTFCDEGVDYVVEGVKVERDTSFCAYYTSSQTCDSIRCVEVVFEPLPQEEEWVEMCRGESYEWQGQALDNDTTFCLTYTGSNGCDSTWCLNLEFSESYVFYDSYNFCQDGADYLVEGVKVEQDTSFCVNYVSLAGCDSLRCVEVIFEPLPQEELWKEICEGEDFFFADEWLSESGVYADTLIRQEDCDSIFILTLSVNAVYEQTLDTIITEGTAIEVGGQLFSETGQYDISLLSTTECDSIIHLNLEVITSVSEKQAANFYAPALISPSTSG
ncbi:MAG: hypothetical protein GY751_12650, partial [Bacteroidetes bacterium]|nr:hypothetical protein [Bacteroidota bacterium]